jgi:hypothetical protein
VRAAVHGLVFLVSFGNGSIGHDIKPRLRLGDQVSILVFLQANVLLLQLLLRGFMAFVHGFGVRPHVEALRHQALILALSPNVHLSRTVELARPLFSMFTGVGGRIVEVVRVLLAVVGNCLRVLLAGGAAQLALIADVVVGRKLPHEIFLADAIEVRVLDGINGSQSLCRIHTEQLLHEVDGPGGSLAQIALVDGV